MTRSFLLAFITTAVGAVHSACAADDTRKPAQSKATYILVPTSAQRVRAQLTVEIRAPRVQADEWFLYTVQIPELPGQTAVRTALSPRGKSGRDLSEWARPLLVGYVAADGPRLRQSLTVRIDYDAILIARKLQQRTDETSGVPPIVPLDSRSRRLALAPGHQFDFGTKVFQEWLNAHELRRKSEEGEIDFARRVFEFITANFQHFESSKPDRRASRVCEAGKTDRGGLAMLFVSVMRANDIPATVMAGRRVRSTMEQPDKKSYDLQTVMSMFFVPEVGWVPLDVPEGLFAKTPEEKVQHFGNDAGDFLTVHLDTDPVLDTVFGRQTPELLVDVSWFARGAGSLDGASTRSSIRIQTEPVDLKTTLARKSSSRSKTKAKVGGKH